MRARLSLPALALALGAALLPAVSQATLSAGSEGAEGIGDEYFPLDGNGGIDVVSYDVDNRYRFGSRKLSGHTVLVLRATEDLTSFNLDFLLPVKRVRVAGAIAGFAKPRAHELRITPTAPLVDGQEYRVRVSYAGHPGTYKYAGERNWLANKHEVVAMNEPHMAPWWFPANDHPQDKALMDITITAPKANKVIANGKRVSRHKHGKLATTHWRASEPMAPYLAFFAAGKYAVDHGTYKGLPWYVAASKALPSPETSAAMALMRRTPALVNLLTKDLGAYPFSQTGGLTTGLRVNFALENQTRPTYPYVGGVTNNNNKLLVHELSHQWFGDSVSVHQWRDIWLNEGFASFMELRYDERKNHRSAKSWLRTAYDNTPINNSFWTVKVGDPGVSHLFASAVYYRGAMTLQALRNRVGNATLWQILRTWIAQHQDGNGTTEEFIDLAEEVSGQNLYSFFQAWLYQTSKPLDTPANGLGPDSKSAASRPAAGLARAPAGSAAH